MLNNVFKLLQDYVMSMIDMVKGLPLVIAILVVIAIIVLPDPLIILGSIVVKKIKLIVA